MKHPYKHLKTGHIVVRSDFNCTAEQGKSNEFWQEKMNNREVIFVNQAFDVREANTSRISHYNTIYHRNIVVYFKDKHVLHIFQSGDIGGLISGDKLIGIPTDLYCILPWEKETNTSAAQVQVVFEHKTYSENEYGIIMQMDFYTNDMELSNYHLQ